MSGERLIGAAILTGAAYLVISETMPGQGAPSADQPADARLWGTTGGAMQTYQQMQAQQQAQQQQGGNQMLNFLPFVGLALDWITGRNKTSGGNTGGATAGTGGASASTGYEDQGGTWANAGNSGATASTGGVRGLLDLIGRAEAPGGYTTVYGGSQIQPPRPITTMTVAEVLDWQDRSVAAGSASSAAGRYQVIRGTLRAEVNRGTVSMNDLYSPATQDRIAISLMRQQGLDQYQAGTMSAETFGNRLARTWAGLPVLTGAKAGRSYYAGDGLNGATVSTSTVLNALRGAVGGWV